jgi:hypothetical protein
MSSDKDLHAITYLSHAALAVIVRNADGKKTTSPTFSANATSTAPIMRRDRRICKITFGD